MPITTKPENHQGREPPLEDAAQMALSSAVLDGSKWFAAGLVIIYSVFIAMHLLAEDYLDPGVRVALATDTLLTLGSAAWLVALLKKKLQAKTANTIAAIFGVAVAWEITITSLAHDPVYLTYTSFAILALGIALLSHRALAASLGLIAAVLVPASVFLLSGDELLQFLVITFTVIVLSAAVHQARYRTRSRLYRLRLKDMRTKKQLADALTRVEEELNEHRRTENARRRLEEQLLQSQKMEAIGVLAGGIAHDMNNILGAITAYASLVQEETEKDDPRSKDLEEVLAASRRGAGLTRDLLSFARREDFKPVELSMATVCDDVIKLLRPTLPKKVSILDNYDEDLDMISGDPGRLGQVVMNLAINSSDAMAGEGTLSFATSNRIFESGDPELGELPAGRYVKLEVEDTGQGMDPHTLSHAFEPFFTTKEAGEGTGLGLSMVYGTVQNHGGRVWITSEEGEGTKVTAIFPSVGVAKQLSPSIEPISVDEIKGTGTVLVVDDEAMIRTAVVRILHRLGYDTLSACNGEEALKIFDQRGPVDLVILDIAMPVMDGSECFRRLKERDPDVKVLISSGYAGSTSMADLLDQGALGLLKKPYELGQLGQAVSKALLSKD